VCTIIITLNFWGVIVYPLYHLNSTIYRKRILIAEISGSTYIIQFNTIVIFTICSSKVFSIISNKITVFKW